MLQKMEVHVFRVPAMTLQQSLLLLNTNLKIILLVNSLLHDHGP